MPLRQKITRVLCLALLQLGLRVFGQQPGAAIDILHYAYTITLSDQHDRIEGEAIIRFKALIPVTRVALELKSISENGKGMRVIEVRNAYTLPFEHRHDTLWITLGGVQPPGTETSVIIRYAGIPDDGLIIGNNKYGERGFFADHWPNRAHHWLPCVDHPADKATVNFTVIAPSHYQVIANGTLKEKTKLPHGFIRHQYAEPQQLPTKVMTMGAAAFAVEQSGQIGTIPVYSWVYPRDKAKGFYDYAQALEVLPFYVSLIGPYAYDKLANVQSKTRFGGLENANTIFYAENSVTGQRMNTALIAHEIAHQWFGNMVTEKEWAHVWLSEGFATYLTNQYMKYRYGNDTLVALLKQQREEVIEYAKTTLRPVVDSGVTDYMQLLNPNSYQKAGWVLHMLHHQLGDSLFTAAVRTFYHTYGGRNASTEDFQAVAEAISQTDLSAFFQQWLYQPGHPHITITWSYNATQKMIRLRIVQTQPDLFTFPLHLQFKGSAPGTEWKQSVQILQRNTDLEIPLAYRPLQCLVDPDTQLLFEWTEQQDVH